MKIKVFIVLILLFAIANIGFCADTKKDSKIKRTIVILPFYNQNNVAEFEYLSETIRDGLFAKLQAKDMFNFISFSDIADKSKSLGFKPENLINEKNAIRLCLSFNADVVIVNKFAVSGSKIIIFSNAYDVFTGKSVVSSMVTGDTGIEIFSQIEFLTNEMSGKMAANFPPVEQKILEELIKKQNDERNNELQKQNESLTKKNQEKDNELKKQNDADKQKKETVPAKNTEKPKTVSSLQKSLNITGIILTSVGSAVLVSGIVIFAVDNAYYKPQVVDKATTFVDYQNYYKTDIGLFASGIALMSVGVLMDCAGIPLIIYQDKNKKMTFNTTVGRTTTFSFSYKF